MEDFEVGDLVKMRDIALKHKFYELYYAHAICIVLELSAETTEIKIAYKNDCTGTWCSKDLFEKI